MEKTGNICIHEGLLLEPNFSYLRRTLVLASKIELVINNARMVTEGNT